MKASLTKCLSCGESSRLISEGLPVCLNCIRSRFEEIRPHIEKSHRRARLDFDLPVKPPRDEGGVKCNICVNKCQIGEGGFGFCGLRENRHGKIFHHGGTRKQGLVSWYYDALPTNCVADWVCPAGSESGYPDYSYSQGVEYGYENLAVFYEACCFDCLFCQNWHFRKSGHFRGTRSAEELANAVRKTTSCICYFGGDPSPQLDHAIAASRLSLEKAKERVLRICWETNGSMRRQLLEEIAQLSLITGGCIKFDLKAFDDKLNIALCGVTNKQTLDNFRWLAQFSKERPDPPLLVASTLLVPGYVDVEEISKIARFISSLDQNIPYSLLAFHPCFYMNDLPRTSHKHAEQAFQAAKAAGLKKVRIGNLHLLSDDY